MANTDKDTIYVDIDDEITGIIDKVKASNSKVVALVLPKRASVFQSIVNMKLLKRAVDGSSKNLVLITSEAGLLPLAGAAGIHVAKTLTSRPEIPNGPLSIVDNDQEFDEDESPDVPGALSPSKTVGELAGSEATLPRPTKDGVETLTLDNEDPAEDAAAADEAKDDVKKKGKKDGKNKKLKIPNFNKFRLLLIIFVLLILVVIIGFFVLNSTLDKAKINITTDATNVSVSANLNLSTSATAVELSSDTLPSKYDQEQKSFSQQEATTGQKNEGDEASGSVTMTATECNVANPLDPPTDVPAGTGLSSNGQTFITQDDTSFTLTGAKQQKGSNSCYTYPADGSTNITAQSPGSAYNVSGVTFAVAGRSDITSSGSANGGSDNIVQTVNQNDINNAKSKITATNSGTIKTALQSQLKSEGYYAIPTTFVAGTPTVTSSASVGQAASTVTVTEAVSYSMFGVHESDLQKIVDSNIDGQINTGKQSILDDGISTANFTVDSLTSTGGQISMSTTGVAGPELNIATIKKNAAGLQPGDIKSQLTTDPNVTNVSVSLSPFWVSHVPKNTAKITVTIEKPANKSNQ